MKNLNDATQVLADTASLLVITGAGVSAESGLPTFRGANGLYDQQPDLTAMLSADGLARDPKAVWNFINDFRIRAATASPNAAHRILAKWEQGKRFQRFLLATQNIDGLHQKAGNLRVTELHGSAWQVACPREQDYATDKVFAREFQQIMSEDPDKEMILRRWSEQNQREVWEDRDVPFPALPPYRDPQTRPNILLFDEEYGNRLLWVRDFIRRKPDTVLVIGCSGTLNVLWQLLGDCRQVNPSCRIINLNVEPVDIPDAIHLRMSATEGMTRLDAAHNLG